MARSKVKPEAGERSEQSSNASAMEIQSRKEAHFEEVEAKLPKRYTRSETSFIDKSTSASRVLQFPRSEAEFVACYFRSSRRNIAKYVSCIADLVGVDGKVDAHLEARKRIEERLMPFVLAIAPARTMEINIMCPTSSGSPHKRLLGPSNANGISSQIMLAGGDQEAGGKQVFCTSHGDEFPDLRATTRYVEPDGWGFISDIDDTIKITHTTSPAGILQSTFADLPTPTPGMEEFYKVLDEAFAAPLWVYLSASPYNLYPFLRSFVNEHYPPGPLILRDASWLYLGGLLQSFTQGVQEYKTSRIDKVHSWLPNRKFICIGDSTQSDPETYAAMYAKYPDWIKAIYIRKVVDAPFMDSKNKNKRFLDAFQDVPDHVWRVFSHPKELADHVQHLAGQAHAGVMGHLLGVWCQTEHEMRSSHSRSQIHTPLAHTPPSHTPEPRTPRSPSPAPDTHDRTRKNHGAEGKNATVE